MATSTISRSVALLLTLTLAVVGGMAMVGEKPRLVNSVRVERDDLDLTIRISGEVINDRRVELTALVDGQISSLYTARGARVKAGEVLASMDNRAATARLKRARAWLRQKTVNHREAQARLGRLRQLAEREAVSQETLEEANLHWEAAVAATDVAQAELSLAEVEEDWQQVRAPFDAVVVRISTGVGQWVEAGTPLFSLVALEGQEIEAHVNAADSGRVRLGLPVTLRCDAYPNLVWRSNISWVGPSVEREVDNRLNTFRIRLLAGEESPPLLLGQQVDLEILVERREKVLTLPFGALREHEGVFEVALIDRGRIRYHEVEIGLEGETRVELISGGAEGIAEGLKVVRLDGDSPPEGTRAHFGTAR